MLEQINTDISSNKYNELLQLSEIYNKVVYDTNNL